MISEGYKELLTRLVIPTVSLGFIAIRIYDVDELEEAQIGYSIHPSGTSLIGENPGSWQRNWVVIGYEDGSGDPIFTDIEADGFPVYTAMHGTGAWEPSLKVAEGRENPVQLEANPIEPDERANVLERIQRDNAGIDTSFWENWLTFE